MFEKSEKNSAISRGGGGRKCIEHQLTERISLSSKERKEKKKFPDGTKLILLRFSLVSYYVQQHLSLSRAQE